MGGSPTIDRPRQPATLTTVKSIQTTTVMPWRRPTFHLHDQQALIFLQHQIEFSPTARPVPIEQHPPLGLQELENDLFRSISLNLLLLSNRDALDISLNSQDVTSRPCPHLY
jgi:hypothetical protein